jgi:hypothetical protein
LVVFFIGIAVSLTIAIVAIVKSGLLLRSALNELKTKMETNISMDMMWEQRALLNLLTSNRLDRFCVISKKKVLLYNLAIFAPIAWFGLFYTFIRINCG